MGNQVQSKNTNFYMEDDSVFYPVFCGQTGRLVKTTGEIETSNINSGSDRDFEPGMSDMLMDIGGVTITNNSSGRISAAYLMQMQSAQTKTNWKVTQTGDDGSIQIFSFLGFIRECSFDKSVSPSYSKSFAQIRVCGGITVDVVDPPGETAQDVLSDWWATADGETFIDGASSGEQDGNVYILETSDEILDVAVEGNGFFKVNTTPTLGEAEYQVVDIGGGFIKIQFPADLIFDGSQRVFVEWKRTL